MLARLHQENIIDYEQDLVKILNSFAIRPSVADKPQPSPINLPDNLLDGVVTVINN